jgi:glucose/arabinose dehydrogenase
VIRPAPFALAFALLACGRASTEAPPGSLCPPFVGDGNACTVDACDPATGAIAHTPVPVDDGVACTTDTCNPATGAIAHAPQDSACPSGQTCSATLGCQAAAAGCGAVQPVAGTAIRLQPLVSSGLSSPVHAAAPRGDAARVFVVEQPGRVRLVKGGVLQAAPWLDVSAQVLSGGERGLLSVAFHPAFASNGRAFLYLTGNGTGDPDAGAAGDIRIVEVTVPDPAADQAGAGATFRNLRTVPHPSFANHNGGQLAFGPDGKLYAGTGDGGGGGDPDGNGQDTASRLGKLLRLDPDSPATPVPGNPFNNEVYHYGLRNPWRFSFDRATGDLWIGDVGQGAWEEVDFQAAAAPGQPPPPGTNWGWNVMEGAHCYPPSASSCATAGKELPIAEYPHPDGTAITGGFVYRGPRMPDLAGTYLYADSGTGFVRTLRRIAGQPPAAGDVTSALGGPLPGLVSFGEDGCGELLVVRIGGSVSRIVPAP